MLVSGEGQTLTFVVLVMPNVVGSRGGGGASYCFRGCHMRYAESEIIQVDFQDKGLRGLAELGGRRATNSDDM